MGIEALGGFLGEWELEVALPGAEGLRGRVVFEALGEVLAQRTYPPIPEAPASVSIVLATSEGDFVQHYFDSRGVARVYAMTFDGTMWTLLRTKADLSPLNFCQRYIGSFTDDRKTIDGEWQTSDDGINWQRDFQLTHRRGISRPA